MSEAMEEGESSQDNSSFGEFATMEEFTKNGMKLIMEATKAVNTLPSGSSRDLYSAYPSFTTTMDSHKNQILNVIQNVFQYKGIKGNIVRRAKEEKFELLQECNDAMLEVINSNLDDMQGIKKTTPAVQIQEVRAGAQTLQKYQLSTLTSSTSSPTSAKLISAKNILRPQTNFKVPVDNSSSNPFVPRIKDKPNSLRPLAVLPEYDDEGNIVSYLHPYELEIEKFEPSDEQLVKREPHVPENMDNFEYIYVDTEEKLAKMLEDLRNAKELAVDLEHHSYRTYLGITCLMQISSRTKDYIVDTIALREELHILNEVFTRPSIVKVFHGADCDIEWLQRDLSLYIVNMFDTHQAAKRLGFARLSLAFLLKHYCNIDADKTFQLADWRMRPLPEQLMKYAQQDTHFLLYIYDLMINDLLKLANDQATLVKGVYHDSKIICLKRYVKPIIMENSYRDFYLKSKRSFNNQQLFALKEIFAWRDKIAREEDESCPYVLPTHMMFQISESLPREMQGILACCNPIPPLVRQHLNHLHQIVLKAREQPVIKPIMSDKDSMRPSVNLNNKKDLLNNPLYSPHDLSHHQELRDDLPTLIGKNKLREMLGDIKVNELKLNIFDKAENGYCKNVLDMKFISPYQRYKLMIPFMEAQRKREMAQEEERRKQLLEEKKKQLPSLEIVKIDDVDLSLKEMKKSRPHDNDAVDGQKTKRWKKDHKDKEQPPQSISAEQEKAIENSLHQVAAAVENMKKNAKNNNRGKPQKSSDFRQSSNKPVFDYTQVSYDRFQGGSSSGNGDNKRQNKNKFSQKFKGGKKNKGNFDKMFNFSNFRLNKK